jgi:hypothetical protein
MLTSVSPFYRYTPPASTQSIDGAKWALVSKNGPFSDANGDTDPVDAIARHATPQPGP